MPLSPKQREFLNGSTSGYNLASGAIRSGKSFTHVLRILKYIVHEAQDTGEVLLSAKRSDSIESNLVRPLRKLVEMDPALSGCFKFPGNYDPITFADAKRKIIINKIGAHDEAAEEKIRGMTLQAWFPDELTLHPQGFVRHAIGRLSAAPRLMVGTTNPESRSHYIYQDFVASGLAKVWSFALSDNPSLDPQYVKDVTEFYRPSPTYYARFILGEWAGDPDRQVVPEWTELGAELVQEIHRPRFFNPTVGMDVGFRDFTFVVFGYYDFENDRGVVEGEVLARGETTDFVAKAIRAKEEELGYEKPSRYSDTDARMIEDLTRLNGLTFSPTRKDNKEAQINALRMAIAHKKIIIHPRCENLIRHLSGAIWNERKTEYERTERDGHFDGVDALIYWWRSLNRNNPVPRHLPEWNRPEMFVSPNYQPQDHDAHLERAFTL